MQYDRTQYWTFDPHSYRYLTPKGPPRSALRPGPQRPLSSPIPIPRTVRAKAVAPDVLYPEHHHCEECNDTDVKNLMAEINICATCFRVLYVEEVANIEAADNAAAATQSTNNALDNEAKDIFHRDRFELFNSDKGAKGATSKEKSNAMPVNPKVIVTPPPKACRGKATNVAKF